MPPQTSGSPHNRTTPLGSEAPVITATARRALRALVWSTASRIAKALADVGGNPTEARAWVAADGGVVVMADWRGRPLTPDEMSDAADRVALALGVAPTVVQVADTWRWADSNLELAWRSGITLPVPPECGGPTPTPG